MPGGVPQNGTPVSADALAAAMSPSLSCEVSPLVPMGAMKMGELNLLPAVRAAEPDALIVADGTSCRQQICDGASRNALHVARVLQQALVTN